MRLIEIWKDSVWSKIISVGILALITPSYYWITSDKGFEEKITQVKLSLSSGIQLWIILVVAITGLSVYLISKYRLRYDKKARMVDRLLFQQIRESVEIADLYSNIRSNGFSSNPFHGDILSALLRFLEDSKRADFHFLHRHLEKLKKKVVQEFDNLESAMSGNIYGANSGWLSIPSEWEFTQPERMQRAISLIKKHEDKAAAAFKNFIEAGRRTLKV